MTGTTIEASIQNALVELLKAKLLSSISVSELAREAHVARGTFYKRYSCVRDVYQQLVLEVLDSCRSVGEQVACIRCGAELDRPEFCGLAQTSERFDAIMKEPSFLQTMLQLDDSRTRRHFMQLAERMGLSPAQARAVFTFQSSGCHSLAASRLPESPDWAESREAVDCFIAGGLAALSAQYGAEG